MVSVVLLLWESGRSTREEGEKTAEWGLSISVVEYLLLPKGTVGGTVP